MKHLRSRFFIDTQDKNLRENYWQCKMDTEDLKDELQKTSNTVDSKQPIIETLEISSTTLVPYMEKHKIKIDEHIKQEWRDTLRDVITDEQKTQIFIVFDEKKLKNEFKIFNDDSVN